MLGAYRNPCIGSNRKTWRGWDLGGETSARWKQYTVGPPCPRVPYPRLAEFTDAEPADTEGRLYSVVCIRDWNIRRFGVHGGSWNQSSVDTKGQLFEGARVISGGGNHLKQRSRLGNAGWRRPSRRLEVL